MFGTGTREPVTEPLDEGLEPEATLETGAGDGQTAAVQGQDGAPADAGQVSGEAIEELVSQVMQRVEAQLAALSQDLQQQVDRRVQSSSDRTASRLDKAQRDRLAQVDRMLGKLKEYLGGDYDQVRRSLQLDVLLDAEGEQQPEQTQPDQAQGQAVEAAAVAYLESTLGNPETLTRQEEQYLRQSPDWKTWYKRVNEIAQKRKVAPQQPPGRGDAAVRGKATTAQPPKGTGAPGTGAGDAKALQARLNAAYARGDYEEAERIGREIDKLVSR